ncbi:hypothetical protein CAPTEDRAFT_167106 [Capitella teleta]|uniref:Calcium channel flower n=1 Tax=Capitella teleta TaxID=283909 RepID=R7V8Y5_CAPTE|nr:hypothetical protein CAPTEDRAFT_167106 [Capitella teleta]|eukprot:ELU12821.1 hypothetical protein CAPTEDRAFT_167106 [Capitella teleta]
MGQGGSRGSEPIPQGPEEGPNNPEATWWCRLFARLVGGIGGSVAIILGVLCCTNIIHPMCIVAGILQMISGFIVLVFEAPICCTFVEITKPIANFAENRPFFHKAIIFGILSIPPFAMCFGLTTLFGSGLIFATGVLYGLMALGKKADREVMIQNARPVNTADNSRLVDNEITGTADPNNPFSGPMKTVP